MNRQGLRHRPVHRSLSVLQIRSVINRTTLNYGYDESAFLTARMGLFDADYPKPESREQFFNEGPR